MLFRTVIALTLIAPALHAADFSKPPQPEATEDVSFPHVQELLLDNGLRVFFLPGAYPAKSVMQMIFPRLGNRSEPKPGIASVVAALVTQGTTSKDAEQYDQAVKPLGEISAASGADAFTVQMGFLTKNMQKAAALFAETVRQPAFRDGEFELGQSIALSGLREARGKPAVLADRTLGAALLPNDKYGKPIDEKEIQALTPSDAKEFYAHADPKDAALVISGGMSAEQAFDLAKTYFGDWRAKANTLPLRPAPFVAEAPKGVSIHVVVRPVADDKASEAQSQIRVGHLGLSRNDPNYTTALLMNAVLGGMFTSHINEKIREQEKWSYGVRSGFNSMKEGGTFVVSGEVQLNATAASVKAIVDEMRAILKPESIKADEFSEAQMAIPGALASRMETTAGLVKAVAERYIFGMDPDSITQLRDEILAVKHGQAQAATRLVQPDDLVIVVVTDPRRMDVHFDKSKPMPILEALKQLGRVKLYDPRGNPMPEKPGS